MSKWLEVVLNVPLMQSFTYKEPEVSKFPVEVGKRAEVTFGNRKMTSYIIAVHDSFPTNLNIEESKIKRALRILDEEPLFTEEHIQLARWISHQYLCSLGEAISAMLPSGRRDTDGPGFSFSDDATEFESRSLSEEQTEAVEGILSTGGYHYLYGCTGSGKTEVFLQAAERLLSQNKGVIYLVPEIGLTHQVIEAVIRRFGNTAAVLHSGLTPSQRLSEWHRILKREARVVIGTRSAVFAPVPDLGMIIIDEEHDGSYKSGNTPRYHGRQVAMYRCSKLNIPLVMGSATPSVEAWYLMEQNKIQKHTLTRRLAGGKPPEIELVDLSKYKSNVGALSPVLTEEIHKTLEEKRQTILFLNRRGFTHFFRCNTCGFELKCKNCSVSLTYHKLENRLRCHYCGWSITPPTLCPECKSLDVGYAGFGTEYIEQEVASKFPSARIQRIDTDSLSNKNELHDKLESFRNGEIDILLGTQMVAKGLNFPRLKLVGVILADTGLHMPDFRASERTFALITQVAGRAGRFFPDGKVIVQSYSPGREAISFACSSDINGFYKQEIEQRRLLGFPPFSRLIRLVFRSSSEKGSQDAATGAVNILNEALNTLPPEISNTIEVMGPAECPLSMIAANYRWQILLRANEIAPLLKLCTVLLYRYKQPTGVYIEADTDPVSLL